MKESSLHICRNILGFAGCANHQDRVAVDKRMTVHGFSFMEASVLHCHHQVALQRLAFPLRNAHIGQGVLQPLSASLPLNCFASSVSESRPFNHILFVHLMSPSPVPWYLSSASRSSQGTAPFKDPCDPWHASEPTRQVCSSEQLRNQLQTTKLPDSLCHYAGRKWPSEVNKASLGETPPD